MNILADFNLTEKAPIDQLISLIDEGDLSNFNLTSFYKTSKNRFIIRISSDNKDDLDDKLNQYVYLLFHFNYFYSNGSPLIAIESTLKTTDINEVVNNILSSHGFLNSFILIHSNNRSYSDNNFIKSYDQLNKSNLLETAVLDYESIIVCQNYDQVIQLMNKQKTVIDSSVAVKFLYDKLNNVIQDNRNLKQQISWQASQLNNHKLYLEVLKMRYSQGAFYPLYMKIISIINRMGPFRKFAKYIHSKLFNKK